MKSIVGLLLLFCLAVVIAANIHGLELGEVYKPVGKCPVVDGAESVFLPDDRNASVFYHCHGGKPWPKVCPDNLIWSQKNSTCVHRH